MILTSVRMEGVRCFADPIAVSLAKDRVNLVAGPNGGGKSTLIQAARRCLLDSYTSTAASDLQPWADGRTPEITIQFEHGGASYRLTKRFVKHKSATLEKKKANRGRCWRKAKRRSDAVRQMLLSTGRNDDGIFGVLWSAQGALPMEGVPKAVLENVRAGLGAQIGHLALEKRLQKLYEENFQPKRSKAVHLSLPARRY